MNSKSIGALLVLPFLAGACSSGRSPTSDEMLLPKAHAAAIRDSVKTFLEAFAADLSAPPIGKKVRDALAPFYAQEIVMSADLAPEEPMLIQTMESLAPPDELVSQPNWIKSTRFAWGALVITPLSPGLATYTAKYVEHVTDTTGTVTDLPGVQLGVVRNGLSGWRFVTIQSSHPMATHQRQTALGARMAPSK